MRVPAAIVGLGVLLVYAWWTVARPPFSASATAAVLVAGITAAGVGVLAGRPARPMAVQLRRPWAWVMVLSIGGLWQLAAYFQHPRFEHPTLSSLANALLDSQPARAAAFLLWILMTVELARR